MHGQADTGQDQEHTETGSENSVIILTEEEKKRVNDTAVICDLEKQNGKKEFFNHDKVHL